MSEALILDPDGIEGLCCAPYVRKRRGRPSHCCTRPKGHQGCHWTPIGEAAERFLVWRDGVTVLRATLPRMRLLASATDPGRVGVDLAHGDTPA